MKCTVAKRTRNSIDQSGPGFFLAFDPVPYELLEFLHLRESPCFLSGLDNFVVDSDLEDATFAGG